MISSGVGQRLFNRLMFLAFIERKDWLKIDDRTDYLAGLWDTYAGRRKSGSSFYRDHLVPLFFEGLNQPDRPPGQADPRFGIVPYLNGGLFEKADDGSDDRAGIVVPDKAVESILTELFARYNFTVAESTPLEVEVAVDPEMLGKVFEELVTGRHEQGSYYTPKPIVSFMCREALVEFLATRCPKEKHAALESFVHDHQPAGLKDAEAVLAALRSVTVCDLACGSGAYLLGMLHELLDLRTCLFAANQKLDAPTAHERKLEIIERNLYGVDLDSFAVNIARLRLWLSLAVDFDGKVPPPLPNLDFKIEQGDALAAPAPQELFQRPAVVELQVKKAEFLRAHGKKKQKLWEEIEKAQADLAVWQQAEGTSHGFNWGVEFAEVFLGDIAKTTIGGDLNLGHELAAQPQRGGFDIVVANPPYVRMELIKPQKPVLRKRFPHVHAERADLYIYFYARAQELLRSGGVAAFISSNKWLRSGYGESLRQHLLDAQNFRLVMDFGELGVFDTAATDAAIFLWQKKPRAVAVTRWAMVKDLKGCYAEGVRRHFLRLAVDVPASQFGKGKPRLATSAAADLRSRMEKSGPRFTEAYAGLFCYGIKTGLNAAFLIDAKQRAAILKQNPEAKEIIHPCIAGDDIRRYELHYRNRFLIYTYHGVDIRRFPAVKTHLESFRSYRDSDGKLIGLEHRATQQEWYELQQPQRSCEANYRAPKIVLPDIGKELRFSMDDGGHFIENTAFAIAAADYYLLGVLNARIVWDFLKEACAALGDRDEGGRLRFLRQYIEMLPVPRASAAERKAVGELARKVQELHVQRRKRVERFLRDLGLDPAQSTSRNPMEQPWNLSATEFAKRAKRQPVKFHESARDETAALTEQIAKLETGINARVATLYGL
jgi:methylase of polypeptide subunit release factors